MANLYQDNFDATSAGSLPSGWKNISGSWQVSTTPPVSGHSQSFTDTATKDGDVALQTGATASADMELLYSFVVPSAATSSNFPSPGAIVRASSDFSSAYLVLLYGGLTPQFTSFKRTGGSFSQLSNASPGITFAAGNKVNVRVRVQGTAIKARLWLASGSEPTAWQLSITDGSVTAAGYSGFYYGADGTTSPIFGVTDMYVSDATTAAGPVAAPNTAPNAAGIVYSPGNWNVTSTAATTVNAGAYFSTLTTSASVTLNFNVANNSSPASEIEYRVDGFDAGAPWTTATVAATVALTMPSGTSSAPYHLVEVRVKSTSETINRWTAPSNTAVVFTGFTLASGATLVAPGTAPGGKVLFFGDSITEGVRTVNQSATNDTDRNSAAMGWAYRQKDLLGVEVGVIGFGGSGLTVTGSGNVPVLSTSYSAMYGGQSRTPDTSTALIVVNIGTNDQSATAASVTSAMVSTLNGMLSAYPSTPIALMRPFGGYQASALQAAIAQCSAPSRVTWIDTTGFLNTAYGIDSTGLHPTGPNDLAVIAPKVAAALRPLLTPSVASFIPFRGMFAA